MADKCRTTFPISVSFSESEIPTPEKLSGFGKQTKNGLGILEYLIGDPWNQSGDSFLSAISNIDDYALMLPNVSRCMGQTKFLSPMVPSATHTFTYTYSFASDTGKYEIQLPLPPNTGTSYTWSGAGAPSTKRASKGLVVASGDYYVDEATGYMCFYDAASAVWSVSYTVDLTDDGDISSEATFSVIPDPDTDAAYEFQSVKIAYVNGVNNSSGYYICLPPRGPLDSDKTISQSPSGIQANMSVSPEAEYLYWQDYDNGGSDVNAAITEPYATHYRYNLPKLITDNWSNGASLPSGFFYLWDQSTSGGRSGTVIEGLSFSAEAVATPRKWILITSGTALDTWCSSYFSTAYPSSSLTDNIASGATHTPGDYPSTGLRLICCGTSISHYLFNLAKHFWNHDHSESHSLPTSLVDHSKLTNLFAPGSNTPQWEASTLSGDDHPPYLHRGTNASSRDKYENGMFGDLLMLSIDSSSNYQNTNTTSSKILFNHPTLGSSLYGSGEFLSVDTEGFYINDINNTNASILFDVSNSLTRLTVMSAGSTTIDDVRFSDLDLYADTYYSNDVSDATYGTSGGGYGEVKYYSIYPAHMVMWRSISTPASPYIEGLDDGTDTDNMFLPYVGGTDYVDNLYYVGGNPIGGAAGHGYPVPILSLPAYSAPNKYHVSATFDLPFSKYCIVNVVLTLINPASSPQTFLGKVALFRNNIAAGGAVSDSLSPADWNNSLSQSISARRTYKYTCFSPSAIPLVEIVHSDYSGGLGGPLIKLENDGPAIGLAAITLMYRVKQY